MQWGNSEYKTPKVRVAESTFSISPKRPKFFVDCRTKFHTFAEELHRLHHNANSLKIESTTPTRILEIVELLKRNAIEWLSYSDTLTLQQLHAK